MLLSRAGTKAAAETSPHYPIIIAEIYKTKIKVKLISYIIKIFLKRLFAETNR